MKICPSLADSTVLYMSVNLPYDMGHIGHMFIKIKPLKAYHDHNSIGDCVGHHRCQRRAGRL